MNTPMVLPPDLIDLLAEFGATRVEYLVVGGQALALHGRPRFTKDADLSSMPSCSGLDARARLAQSSSSHSSSAVQIGLSGSVQSAFVRHSTQRD